MATSTQYPSLVMIIRHGEKPGDSGSDKDGGPNLSVLGSARAAALPSLFTPNPMSTPVNGMEQLCCDLAAGVTDEFTGAYSSSGIEAGESRFAQPDFLFATAPSGSSNRPVETVTPLAQAISTTINDSYPDSSKGIDDLTAEVLTNNPNTYAGKTILICWHHGSAPQLAEAFGVPATQLTGWDPWNPNVFDLVFYITWDSDQAGLVVDYQQLLYGDTSA